MVRPSSLSPNVCRSVPTRSEEHGRRVLLKSQVLNPGQDEPIFSEGELVPFLRRVGHAEPEIRPDS